MKENKIKISIVDDHELFRHGIANIIGNFDDYSVLFEAGNGKELVEQLEKGEIPDIILLDINMPGMDGFETALWLKRNHPDIKILALSMYDTENAIIRMLTNGAKGYIFKNSSRQDVRSALDSISKQGYYFSEIVTSKLVHALNHLEEAGKQENNILGLNDREIEFMKYACTDLSYPEIAKRMFISSRTVENYRDSIYERFDIKSRVGLVMFAIKNGIVHV